MIFFQLHILRLLWSGLSSTFPSLFFLSDHYSSQFHPFSLSLPQGLGLWILGLKKGWQVTKQYIQHELSFGRGSCIYLCAWMCVHRQKIKRVFVKFSSGFPGLWMIFIFFYFHIFNIMYYISQKICFIVMNIIYFRAGNLVWFISNFYNHLFFSVLCFVILLKFWTYSFQL